MMNQRLTNPALQELFFGTLAGQWVPAEAVFRTPEREQALPPGYLWCAKCAQPYRPQTAAGATQCPSCGVRVRDR